MKLSTTDLILASDAAIDLQMHTTYSDGTWTPEQLIDYVVSEAFSLVAITDHDRVDTIAAVQDLAIQKRLPVLVAAEMSASWDGEATDVLCYGFDPRTDELRDLVQDVLRRQEENTREVYENLCRKEYISPSPQELVELLAKPGSQQPHGLLALLEKRGSGIGETSPRQMITDAGCFFATNDIAAVVDAVHRSGGVCLIAHPGRGGNFICYDVPLLDQLRQEVPIDGLEVYYPDHAPEQIAVYLDYAQKHRLLTSSGSDSHGRNRKPIKYQAELSRSLLERLGIQIKFACG